MRLIYPHFIISVFILLLLTPSVFAATVTVSPAQKTSTNCGGTETITVNVVNTHPYYGALCWWSKDGINWNKATNSCLATRGGSYTFPINLDVPDRESTTHTVQVACINYGSSHGCGFLWLDTCYTNTCSASSQWSAINANTAERKQVTIQCDSRKQQSDSARTATSNAISNANSAVDSAGARINEASKIGADVNSATEPINQAKADVSNADSLFSSAINAYNNKDYESAISYFEQAQAKAESARSKAATTESAVDRIMEEFNRKKTEAQNKVSDANSAIDTTKQRIDDGDKILQDATIIGLDTAQAKADIATSRSQIKTAEDYYGEASNLFSSNNFEGAKSKAESAIELARDADTRATGAYNRLQERITVAGEASKAILNANSEVSQMNEILTKMDYIIRSTEKWGVNLVDTKSVFNTAGSDIDGSEDLLAQAKNRQASGSFDEAVNFANNARDKAANSKNRLDTITHTMSMNIQDTLENISATLQSNLTVAESEVDSAGNTYGATPNLVIAAQNDLADARKKLDEAKGKIEEVASAKDLMPLLDKAETAFKSLDATQEKIVSTLSNAKSAKRGLLKKAAVGAAIAAAAGGGGFLYYRRRKKKPDLDVYEEEKKEIEDEDKQELMLDSSTTMKNEPKKAKQPKKKKAVNKNKKKITNKRKKRGRKISLDAATISITKQKKCNSCGNSVKQKHKFCGKCGTVVN